MLRDEGEEKNSRVYCLRRLTISLHEHVIEKKQNEETDSSVPATAGELLPTGPGEIITMYCYRLLDEITTKYATFM